MRRLLSMFKICRMDDTYMDVFLVVYQLLKDAGKLKVPGI
jgi:hypothetical protein